MVLVHAFVAEVLANLVDALEAAHDEPLQVQLRGDAQVEVDVQRVVVGDEGACAGTAGDGLQDGRFHFGIAGFVQHGTHGADDFRALQEGIFHAVVHDEVHVALAVAQFGVLEGVIGHAVLVLHDGQRAQALGQYGQLLGVHADFARLRAEHEALHADEVAQVQQAFEDGVIHIFVLVRADVVAGDVHLDAPFGVLQFDERGLAHDAAAHHASRDGHLARLGIVPEVRFDVG